MTSFKFAHIADCHLGAWSNHPELSKYPVKAFHHAIDNCINENIDFLLISGDLFDTSMPGVEALKECVKGLKRIKDAGIRTYIITGSHDYSPSGKTMISVIEETGLVTNVSIDPTLGKLEFIQDKTGAKITGMFGKKGSLEHDLYQNISSLSAEDGFNIFMMHSAITEYKPEILKDMASLDLIYLPKNFNYYANGHVHVTAETDEPGYGKIVFPGPLFPTSFDELEKGPGSFVIATVNGDDISIQFNHLNFFQTIAIKINAESKTPEQVEAELKEDIMKNDLKDALVLLKVKGTLASGRPNDIDFKSIVESAKNAGAMSVKRSIGQLRAKEYEDIEITSESSSEIEKNIIKETVKNMPIEKVEDLMHALSLEKSEGETKASFESRLTQDAKKILLGDIQ